MRNMQVQTDSNTDVDIVTKKVAEYVGMVTGYLQAHDVSEMLQDANRLIRRFPEHSLVAAAAAGLLLGAAFRRR
jgi:ElaB/YqjD/DUF883 family membrane-anchored ribosome-binding protein